MKSVCICSSRRFKKEVRKFASSLEKLGATAYIPYHHSGQDEWKHLSESYREFVALGLTHDHFYKIRMSDIVYLYNKGGYSGNSTTMEIGFAVALGKPIYAYSDADEELCRRVLIKGIAKTPRSLFKKLK